MKTLLIGSLMILVTLAIHAIGSVVWLGIVGRWHAARKASQRAGKLFTDLLSTGVVLVVLHLVEVTLWGLLFWVLPASGGMSSLGQAAYFSMVSFTTVGYGDIVLSPDVRILGPMEAMAGIMVMGLTTAILIAVVQRCWKASHEAQ